MLPDFSSEPIYATSNPPFHHKKKLMKNILISFAAAFCTTFSVASELSWSDTGTYVVLDQNRAPTNMFYRLSKTDDKWIMEGKKPDGQWINLSCDAGCEYRTSTATEIQRYFPPDWLANAQIACIQNIAQAFCSYTTKEAPGKAGHVIIALVRDRPIPIFIRRVSGHDQPAL